MAMTLENSRGGAMATVGRFFMSSLLVVVGVQHFLYAAFVSTLVPAWIPWRLFWAYFVGVAFFAAAVGILVEKLTRPAGTLLGVMFLVFVVTTHTPRIVMHSRNGNEWTSGLVTLAMCGGAWIVAKTSRLEERETADSFLKAGPYLFAVATIDAGSTSFSFLIPVIELADRNAEQKFETVGVRTDHKTALVLPPTGLRESYEIHKLEGIARSVIVPLGAAQAAGAS